MPIAGLSATSVSLIAAFFVLAGTLGTAYSAIRGQQHERAAKWTAYKRGVYKRFLDSIDRVAKATEGRAASEFSEKKRNARLAEYRSRYHQTILACSDSVLGQMKKLETDRPRLRKSATPVNLGSPEVIELTNAMQRDVRVPPGFWKHAMRRNSRAGQQSTTAMASSRGVALERSHVGEVVVMYARIARFEGGDTSQIDAVIEGARETIDSNFDSPPEGLEGAKAVWMLVDRENARGLGVTLFETEEDLRRGDDALNAMSPAVDAGQRRSSVEIYEVAHHRER